MQCIHYACARYQTGARQLRENAETVDPARDREYGSCARDFTRLKLQQNCFEDFGTVYVRGTRPTGRLCLETGRIAGQRDAREWNMDADKCFPLNVTGHDARDRNARGFAKARSCLHKDVGNLNIEQNDSSPRRTNVYCVRQTVSVR